MKMLPQVLFWLGLISIPFAWLLWYFGPQLEVLRPVLASVSDPALRAALQEAHAERLGIWVGVWPVSLLVLSQILENLRVSAASSIPSTLESSAMSAGLSSAREQPSRSP